MHLETAIRLFLTKTRILGSVRLFNSTLGKAIYELKKMEVSDTVLIEDAMKFVTLYNMAKHEVNMFEERPRLFCEADAIVSYFAARTIGQAVLLRLSYYSSLNTYEIYTN